jgi:DNA-binding SARP family transcriptional activator
LRWRWQKFGLAETLLVFANVRFGDNSCQKDCSPTHAAQHSLTRFKQRPMTTTDMPGFKLLLAGAPQLQLASGKKLELNLRDALLLALLAIDGPQPRLRLAGLLSPESSAQAARNTLRQRLFALRKQCGHEMVEGSNTLALAQDLGHDLLDAPTLLADLRLAECPEFDQWLQTERQRRFNCQRETLCAQMDALETAGDLGAAVNLAQGLLQQDPLSEDAHRRLIRLHYLRGDRSAAMLAFDRCAEVLKHEVGAAPSAQTMQLLDSIQRAVAPQSLTPRRQVPPSVLRPPRMVGREALRQRILQDIDNGLVAVLVGEAGMGKSRMLAEVGAELEAHHQRFVSAAARPGDAGVPFASLARLLRELVRQCPSALEQVPRNELARFMPELGTAAPAGAERERLVFERAVSALIEASRSEVDSLGFDDLHFADEASLDMLQAITAAPTQTGMRWVLALRPAEIGSRAGALLDALAEAGRLGNAVLEPLSVSELEELVDSLDVPGLVGSALAASLHQQSGGNPLFALETIKRLLIDDVISGHSDQSGALALKALPRPASVLALIERRLGHLSAPALAVARVAAVASADFTIGLAQHVLEQPALLLSDAWSELERAQVLRDSSFAHDLVFEAVLHSIPKPIACHTHGRVAQYLVQHQGEAARIAAHYLAAEQALDALPWLKQAATVAGQALRTKEQMDFWLKAADIEEQAGLKQEAFESLKAALKVQGKAGVSKDLAQGEHLERLAQTRHQLAQARNLRMHQLGELYRLQEAADLGTQTLELTDVALDAELYHDIRQFLGVILAFSGKPDEALVIMQPLQAWIEANGRPELQLEYFGHLAIVLDNVGRLDEAVPHYLFAAEIARSQGLWAEAASVCNNLAGSRIHAGDVHAAMVHLTEAEQILTLFESDEPPTGFAALGLSECHRITGQFKEALHWADVAIERAGANVGVTLAARLKNVLVWVDLGQYARALRELDEVTKLVDSDFSLSISILCIRARLQRVQGEPGYNSLLEQALALVPEGGFPEVMHRVLLLRASSELPLQALAMTEQVIEEARDMGHQGTVMTAWARRAGCLWRHDPALALAAAQRALEMGKTLDSLNLYRPELWLNAALAMRASGLEDQAQEQLVLARDWIMNCVHCGQVPESFVDSFLHRNPINREVLSLVGT